MPEHVGIIAETDKEKRWIEEILAEESQSDSWRGKNEAKQDQVARVIWDEHGIAAAEHKTIEDNRAK